MQCLGELTTWLPLPAALPIFASRYLDDAFGFALGWNVSVYQRVNSPCIDILQSYYGYAIGICTEISAASVIIEYWNSSINVSLVNSWPMTDDQ
jgi:amino acid transporter